MSHSIAVPALAYLFTFSTYGTHLPGSRKGWVDAQHSIPGSPMRPYNPKREEFWRSRLKEHPWIMDSEVRHVALNALLAVCRHRQWVAYGVHLRSTHIHGVIGGDVKPERMLCDLKAYATRALRVAAGSQARQRYWASHGSTRYLWNETSLRAGIDYVLNCQGVRMAVYEQPEVPPQFSHL